jgi:hypothetical protein
MHNWSRVNLDPAMRLPRFTVGDVALPPSTRLATTHGDEEMARDAAGNALLVDIAGNPAPRLPYVELGEATFITGFLGT